MNAKKKVFAPLAGGVLLALLGARAASAQCSAIALPVVVRQEGSTEVLGPIVVTCDSGVTATAGSSIQVTLSGVAASPAAGDNTDTFTLTGGALGNVATTTTKSSCGSGTVSNDTTNFPCPTISPNIPFTSPAPGTGVTTAVSGSAIAFSNITPTVPSSPGGNGDLRIVVRNLRANIAASGLGVGTTITATVSFGGGFAGSPSVVTVANVQAGLNRASSQTGFGRGNGTSVTLQTSDILACAPNRRTPTGTPDTATATDILGLGLTLDNNRNSNALFAASGSSLWRTAAGEDTQFPVSTVAAGAGSGAWAAVNLPASTNTVNLVPPISVPARTGTRFVVTLTGVPAGINVYVLRSINTIAGSATQTNFSLTSGTTAGARWTRVVGSSADGSGGGIGSDVKDLFDRIPAASGTVTIVYELAEIIGGATSLSGSGILRAVIVWTGIPPLGIGNISGTLGLAPVGPPSISPARPQFTAAPPAVVIARTLACVTYLLFSFVVNTGDGAFDTGLAVANTSVDPIAGPSTTPAVPHSGDVTLHFFRQGAANPAPVLIAPNLPAGGMATYVLSQLGSPFIGYVIAVCNFGFGHGFAFINSPVPGAGGAFAMAYQAQVLPNNRDGTTFPEGLGH